MDHVVYVDAKSKAKDMEEIISNKRTMIIRGATGRKLPYGRVNKDDVLYLIRNNGEGLIRGMCIVKSVINSDKMTKDESTGLVQKYQEKLNLSDNQFKKWAGKRYLVLIEICKAQEIEPFHIDKSAYGNMDDWLSVEEIKKIRLK
ncbi:MAG: hypothetical protein ACW981_00880 [Candidatus Hodarchaeales archaeon]|jgi:hypothetical protein